jgi:hypothetical protein
MQSLQSLNPKSSRQDPSAVATLRTARSHKGKKWAYFSCYGFPKIFFRIRRSDKPSRSAKAEIAEEKTEKTASNSNTNDKLQAQEVPESDSQENGSDVMVSDDNLSEVPFDFALDDEVTETVVDQSETFDAVRVQSYLSEVVALTKKMMPLIKMRKNNTCNQLTSSLYVVEKTLSEYNCISIFHQ